MNRFAFGLFVLALIPATAWASQQGLLVVKNWNAMDQCAKEAQAAFPDFTAEAYAKRDAKEKECLQAKNLAPRAPLVPGR
ncbi:MAG TPA: hypothetical protein VGS13_01660 [Stellaceae bacterium]|nr:hypothetical protein [Stellaceae bacterium]